MIKFFTLLFIILHPFFLTPISAQSQKAALKGEISLSGAFALYPMVVKWAEEFKKIHPQVRIDISGGGAGKGMTDALAQVVDMGMVSREIYKAETDKGAYAIPVVKDAVLPTINEKNPLIAKLLTTGLTHETAKRLWEGKFRTWGEVLNLPNRIPVHVFTRSDACGAAETWAAWLGMRQEDLEGTALFGDPGVAATIQKDKVGIGFNNIAYIYDQTTKRPFENIVVLPLDLNGNGKVDEDENFYTHLDTLMKAIAEGRYPSPPARNLYLVTKGKPTKPEVMAFLRFILTEGQKFAPESGYVQLSDSDLKATLEKLSL